MSQLGLTPPPPDIWDIFKFETFGMYWAKGGGIIVKELHSEPRDATGISNQSRRIQYPIPITEWLVTSYSIKCPQEPIALYLAHSLKHPVGVLAQVVSLHLVVLFWLNKASTRVTAESMDHILVTKLQIIDRKTDDSWTSFLHKYSYEGNVG